MRALIATPTAGGVTTTAYTQSVVAATIAIHEVGGTYRHLSVDGADVVIGRNLLAHSMLSDPACTHILFIDSDMAIDLGVFRHIIALKEPMVGAAYTERRMDLGAFARALGEDPNEDRAKAIASNFTVRVEPGEVKVSRGVCKVKAVGFGCVLIAREVFEALIAREIVKPFVSSKIRDLGLKDEIYDFFDEIEIEDGDWLSEDYAFCRRVRELGDVDILAYIGKGVGHVGPFTYGGSYLERMKTGKV